MGVGLQEQAFDKYGNLSLQPLTEEGELVQLIKVAVLRPFPVSSEPMAIVAEHHKLPRTAHFTLDLLKLQEHFPGRENIIVLDSQLHAMSPDAKVPWSGARRFFSSKPSESRFRQTQTSCWSPPERV
ncbi:hypothetical protein V8E36_001719 [Tilletia maclaganii]